jgi:hypothetical protein
LALPVTGLIGQVEKGAVEKPMGYRQLFFPMPSEVLQHALHVIGCFDGSQPKKVRWYPHQGSGIMRFRNMLRMFLRRFSGGNAIGSAHSSSKAKQKRQFVVSLAHLFCGEFFNNPFFNNRSDAPLQIGRLL